MNVTKRMLVEAIYASINEALRRGERSSAFSFDKIATIVDELFFIAGETLKNHKTIEIRNFGTFSFVEQKAKKGRNFRTTEAIDIPAIQKIKFTASPALYGPPARKISCENQRDCPNRISTIIQSEGEPVRICRFYYRCPSRTPDLFQNDSIFSKSGRVLNVTTGELVRATQNKNGYIPKLHIPVVLLFCETKVDAQKIKIPEYFVLTFEKDSVTPTFNSGPAEVSFNNQTKKCYVRNSHFDLVYEINKPVLKNDEVLKILLNAKFN